LGILSGIGGEGSNKILKKVKDKLTSSFLEGAKWRTKEGHTPKFEDARGSVSGQRERRREQLKREKCKLGIFIIIRCGEKGNTGNLIRKEDGGLKGIKNSKKI